MDIFVSLKQLINRVNRLDERYKNIFLDNNNSSNPFSFSQNNTFVWVDKPINEPQCKIENDFDN